VLFNLMERKSTALSSPLHQGCTIILISCYVLRRAAPGMIASRMRKQMWLSQLRRTPASPGFMII
jgi:hypothetical protein